MFVTLPIREWYAGFLQDCPNGKLTPGTFIEMYKMFFPSGDAEKFCQNVFRTFDADKSGTIDFKEFLMAIDVTSAGTPREKLLWAFRYFQNAKIFKCKNEYKMFFLILL